MTLADAGRAEEERILPVLDEAPRGQLVDQRPVHLRVEIELEAVGRPVRVAKPGLLRPTLEQQALPAEELIVDEREDEIEEDQPFRPRLAEPALEHAGHPGRPELAEGAIQFDERQAGSPVERSMRLK